MDNDNLKNLHETEQSMELGLNVLPGYYRSLYLKYVDVGFTEEQAFRMVLAQIAGCFKN